MYQTEDAVSEMAADPDARYTVRVRVKETMHEIDEYLVHLHHWVLDSAASRGIDYQADLGDWLMDVVIAHYTEHPEVLDLRRLMGIEERA